MGMFDSLYIELDGREQEIQTKRFDCILNNYRLGDWIAGSLPGVRVYFDSLWLDGTGKQGRGSKNGQQRFHAKSPVGARCRAG